MMRVLLVGQVREQLVPGEMKAIREALRGLEPEYVPTDPQNEEQHVQDCEGDVPTIVLLPFTFDPHIPCKAIQRGIRHITVSAGEVREVNPYEVGCTPTFKAFRI